MTLIPKTSIGGLCPIGRTRDRLLDRAVHRKHPGDQDQQRALQLRKRADNPGATRRPTQTIASRAWPRRWVGPMLVERRRVVSMHKPALALGLRRFSASPAGEHTGACDRPTGNRVAAPVSVRPATLVRQARERSGGARPPACRARRLQHLQATTTLQQRILHTRRQQRPHQLLSIYETLGAPQNRQRPPSIPGSCLRDDRSPPIPGRRPLGQGSQPRHPTLAQQDRPRG